MYCKNCGKQVNDTAKFCPDCGTPLHARATRSDQQDTDVRLSPDQGNTETPLPSNRHNTDSQTSPDAPVTGTSETQKLTSQKWFIPAVSGGAILLILILLLLFLPGGGNSSGTKTETAGMDNTTGYERDTSLLSAADGNLNLLDLCGLGLTAADEAEASALLNELSDALGIESAEVELEPTQSFTISGSSYYEYAQIHNDFAVYGHSVVLTTDEEGNAEYLSGNLVSSDAFSSQDAGNLSIDTDTAIETAVEYLESEADISDDSDSSSDSDDVSDDNAGGSYTADTSSASAELCWYLGEDTDTAVLSYEVILGFDTVFIDAQYGIVLDAVTALEDDGITASEDAADSVSTTELEGQEATREVSVTENTDGTCSLIDAERKISVYTVTDPSVDLGLTDFQDLTELVSLITFTDDPNQPSAVDALANIEITYDFYSEVLNHQSSDGNGETEIRIFDNVATRSGQSLLNNASSRTLTDDNLSLILVGISDGDTTQSVNLDVMAHEYTHSVISWLGGLKGDEAAAINEALADIMGELTEAWFTGSSDWSIASRDHTALTSEQLTSYTDYTEDTGKYAASTILSHAAWRMWTGDPSVEGIEVIDDTETMAELWYRTILLLNSDATFSDCRTACEAAAAQMQGLGLLTARQVNAVIWAFDQAGISCSSASAYAGDLTVTVYDAANEPTDQFTLTVTDREGNLVETATGTDDDAAATDADSSAVRLSLDPGIYTITVSSTVTSYPSVKKTIVVTDTDADSRSDGDDASDIIVSKLAIYTTFGTSLTGLVTDTDGAALEGASVTITTADLELADLETFSDMLSVELRKLLAWLDGSSSETFETVTGEDGSYTLNLPAGIYTVTFEKDSYETRAFQMAILAGPNTAETTELESPESNDGTMAAADLFAELSQYTFCHASGAGGWSTDLWIAEDGTFTGQYYDYNLGAAGDGYTGTISICDFSGSFGDPVSNDDGSCTLFLSSFVQDYATGTSMISDEILYSFTDPFGMMNSSEFLVYLPGTSSADLPEDVVYWSDVFEAIKDDVLVTYVIYNSGDEAVFYGLSPYDKQVSIPSGDSSSDDSGSETADTEASEAYALYTAAYQQRIADGSWNELLNMDIYATATDGSQTESQSMNYYTNSNVTGYSANDPSGLIMNGNGSMDVGTYYEWTFTYANGVITMNYTEPYEATGSQEVDPGLFNLTGLTEDMIMDASVSDSGISFVISGADMSALGLTALDSVDLGTEVENLNYSDVAVEVSLEDDGTLAAIAMSFTASFTSDGVDVSAVYDLTYQFGTYAG